MCLFADYLIWKISTTSFTLQSSAMPSFHQSLISVYCNFKWLFCCGQSYLWLVLLRALKQSACVIQLGFREVHYHEVEVVVKCLLMTKVWLAVGENALKCQIVGRLVMSAERPVISFKKTGIYLIYVQPNYTIVCLVRAQAFSVRKQQQMQKSSVN